MNSSRDNREYISVNSSVNEQISTLSFKPHISQRLIELEHPRTSLDHEVHHTMRDSYDDRASPSIRPSTANTLDYALWLEAGKHSHKPTHAKSLDSKPPINYNIWRNYRHYYAGVNGQNTARRSRAQTRLSEDTAFKYPIIIPAPSQLGENHLRNFFESNKRELFQNQSHFRMALIQADNDERMLRMLSLKSQQRKPPVAALSGILISMFSFVSFSISYNRSRGEFISFISSESIVDIDQSKSARCSTAKFD